MNAIFSDLLAILDGRDRALALGVFALMVAAAMADMLGVAVIMPFVQVAMAPEAATEAAALAPLRDLIAPGSAIDLVIWMGLVVLLILVGSVALRAFSTWAQVRFAARRKHALATRLLVQNLEKPYEWYLTRHSSEISTTILAEATQAIEGSLFPLMQLIANALVVLFLGATLVAIDPRLALGAAVVLGGGYFLVFWLLRAFNKRIGTVRWEANRERYRLVQEAFGGFKDVKLLGLESSFVERFLQPSRNVAYTEASARILGEVPRFAMQGIVFAAMILAVLYVLSTKGRLDDSIPSLAGFAFAGFRLLPSLQGVYSQATQLKFGAPILASVVAELGGVAERPPASDDRPHPPPTAAHAAASRIELHRELKLENIGYAYPGSASSALKDVRMEIRARSTVGIVGTTGSGKTTLVDVMLGLLEPTEGVLQIDDVPISAGNRTAWQRNVGYVPQQIFLADDTVSANIAFGIPPEEIDEEAVVHAARVANLHDFVMQRMPNGYATEVGERGVRLSGGQRQRIGIARALYRDPSVLMMDEATSALDNVTELAVMEAIDRLEGEKTIILIAHRLSTVRRCERIFLMEQGSCIDWGTWNELVARNANFREMAQLSA